MKKFNLILYVSIHALVVISCVKDKHVQLPEISNAIITDVKDVSAAYLFYDPTLQDSIELNRKNLIGTTNWLINVDKRLTLSQAIPKIRYLQNKKRNAKMHKNENAKNFYTCHDTSINNLGFIEFTNTNYVLNEDIKTNLKPDEEIALSIRFKKNNITINNNVIRLDDVSETIKNNVIISSRYPFIIRLEFSNKLSFQEYITYKTMISSIDIYGATISPNEYILN